MTKTIEQRAIEFVEAHNRVVDAKGMSWNLTRPKDMEGLRSKRSARLLALTFAVHRKVPRTFLK